MRTPREVAVFVVQDGEHLALRRAEKGIWHVAAGVVEDGETHEQAGLRELCEETALALSELRSDLGTQVHGFGVEAPRGWEPVPNEEHDAYRWCGVDDARGLLHWREARELVRKTDLVSAGRGPR